jgi:hypothetical protein
MARIAGPYCPFPMVKGEEGPVVELVTEDEMITFKCSRCEQVKPVQTEGGTGYALQDNGAPVCYACCAELDKEYMREHGKISLYLADRDVTNWPGSLRFPVWSIKKSPHNIARWRYDAWFNGPDGHVWHGVQYGENTQLIHCKRTKEMTE